jgi:hypothetical protein
MERDEKQEKTGQGKARVVKFADLVDYQEGSVVSRTLIEKKRERSRFLPLTKDKH